MHNSLGDVISRCCPPGWIWQGLVEDGKRRGCCSPDAYDSLSKIDESQHWIELKDMTDKGECVDVQNLQKDNY